MSEEAKRALGELLNRLAASCAKEPTPAQRSVLIESILDNRLTQEEIRRGYVAVRDAQKPWWPTPGEFLALCRPVVSEAEVQSEGSMLFAAIRDNAGMAYGKYHPETGVVRERRLIEAVHGPAAGLAFVAAGGARAFGQMTMSSEPFVRKAFLEAYDGFRRDFGAPTTLDPARALPGRPEGTKAIAGASKPAMGEAERRFREMVRNGFREPGPAVDVEARKRQLAEQARELAR